MGKPSSFLILALNFFCGGLTSSVVKVLNHSETFAAMLPIVTTELNTHFVLILRNIFVRLSSKFFSNL